MSARDACSGCSKAKRRCGRQKPACQRCQDKQLSCAYPPPKHMSCFTPLEPSTSPFINVFADEPYTMPGFPVAPFLNADINEAPAPEPMDLAIQSHQHAWSSADWFLSPETWVIDRRPMQVAPSEPCVVVLKRYVKLIQQWLETWVATGSNPFIHSQVYCAQLPSSLQVAYTTLSAYIHRTDANTEMILRIVEARANELLEKNRVRAEDPNQEESTASEQLSILDHLARVHALFAYQYIGLFDGDIRARHVAEPRWNVLKRWVTQLFDCASQNLSWLPFPFGPLDLAQTDLSTPLGPTKSTADLWQTWVLAETVRRTWLAVMGLYAVYLALQQNWTFCPGGVMFTNSKGVWEAESASAWEKMCCERSARFMQRFDAERLFSEASPEDVDDFGKAMMEITFGAQKMERWTR